MSSELSFLKKLGCDMMILLKVWGLDGVMVLCYGVRLMLVSFCSLFYVLRLYVVIVLWLCMLF